MKKSKVLFDSVGLSKVLFDKMIPVQTSLLIDYAKRKILEIGQRINSYHSANHMDRTGNLLNSLCWGVSYRGDLKAHGFYRDASSVNYSYLHEWSKDADFGTPFPVDGHSLAESYIQRYGAPFTTGWRVFFAILAPYWGYWEQGFTMRKFRGSEFRKFAVMAEVYDQVSKELKPTSINIKVNPPTYFKSYDIKWKDKRISTVKSYMYQKWEKYSNGKFDPYKKYHRGR